MRRERSADDVFKTANKLPQVLARAEADAAGAQEAILLNTDGCIAEGTSSNVFWLEGDAVCTTPLPSGALPGVTRRGDPRFVRQEEDQMPREKREARRAA